MSKLNDGLLKEKLSYDALLTSYKKEPSALIEHELSTTLFEDYEDGVCNDLFLLSSRSRFSSALDLLAKEGFKAEADSLLHIARSIFELNYLKDHC
ncbi:hypothetical protein [uncultured Shewanella sp.]|uniref:hypothetical protein n=1 Tax=uncultured Shewanella sp. TaxID=173975 RepID=UPI002612DF5C|nr:hypothetical protein [uncultured Shewanella sp.]